MQYNGSTEIYGIMGDPVGHSLSPAMHNAAFKELGLNKVYVPFPVKDVATAMHGFKALGIKGVSVTIPHKQAVIAFIDDIDPVAEKIAAVNTLVINNNRITGHNTDWQGANTALQQLTSLQDKKVLILGAGGSARAIGFGLLHEKATIMLASRTPKKGQALAGNLQCPWLPLAEAESIQADILINATSVGMRPNHHISPISSTALQNFTIVMDIVYAPLKTRLLNDAEKAGCKSIDGLAMLLFQGAAQFKLWTGHSAPVSTMKAKLMEGICAE